MSELIFNQQPLPTQPRVLFMGTPDFAVPALQSLHTWCVK